MIFESDDNRGARVGDVLKEYRYGMIFIYGPTRGVRVLDGKDEAVLTVECFAGGESDNKVGAADGDFWCALGGGGTAVKRFESLDRGNVRVNARGNTSGRISV